MDEQMTFEELQQIVSMMIDEIMQLKNDNETYRKQLQEMNQVVSSVIGQQEKFLNDFYNTKKNMATGLRIQDCGLRNLRYELADPAVSKESFYYPKILPMEKTIEEIVEKGKSLSRFGDGEFAIMSGRKRQKFQKMDGLLQKKLIEVFRSEDENVLIAIADNYGNLDKYSRDGKNGIRAYMTEEIRLEHKQFIDLNREYHNAYISRPCVLYADCDTETPGKRFENLKRIWDKREVIMIEGAMTRLGVGNTLFDNAASIRRIEGPGENSFDQYDRILQAALKHGKKDTLFLIALGPAATVLAYDLAQNGYQAVDIGHLDLEYEWYLRGGKRCEINTKYNNEMPGGDQVVEINDSLFESQIVEKIW